VKISARFINLILVTSLLTTISSSQSKTKAPNFSLKSAEGETIELAKLKGKVVVVNFWATWCGPCRVEIPGFLEVYKKYKPKGLEIVGISLDESGWEVVRPFVEKNRISYPVVIGDSKIASDYGGIRAIPTTFIVNKQGNVVDGHLGLLQKTQLEKMIKKLL
jgi:cytochrome c biogenesis protein CcmG/thiol:disulfide interchange protein DsbE